MSSNKLPEKITIQMDPEMLIIILKESPRKFLIRTNKYITCFLSIYDVLDLNLNIFYIYL